MDLRESLAAIHNSPGLVAEVELRQTQLQVAIAGRLPLNLVFPFRVSMISSYLPTTHAPCRVVRADARSDEARSALLEPAAAWAQNMIAHFQTNVPHTPKLFPGGTILWTPTEAYMLPGDLGTPEAVATPAVEADWVVADQQSFDTIVLCGSAMFSSHMPQAYAQFLLGTNNLI